MRERVIITSFDIRAIGEHKYFQIKLPANANRIIGIEVTNRIYILEVPTQADSGKGKGGAVQNNNVFQRNLIIGDLRLQSCEEANIFYATYVEADRNVAYLDYTSAAFQPKPYTHQRRALEEPIIVDAESTIIQGMYKDLSNPDADHHPVYTVNVYVWYEVETTREIKQ